MSSPEITISAIEFLDNIVVEFLNSIDDCSPKVVAKLAKELVNDITIQKIQELFRPQYDSSVIPSILDEIDEWRNRAIRYIDNWLKKQLKPSHKPVIYAGNVAYVSFRK